eukprot:jgi/Phyca11/17603/fgenesh1_pg.PHYCAscaffold_29_\
MERFAVFYDFCAADVDIVGQIVSLNLVNSMYQLDEGAVRDFAERHVGSYVSSLIVTENDALWGWTTASSSAPPVIYDVDSAHRRATITDTIYFGQQIKAPPPSRHFVGQARDEVTCGTTSAMISDF